MSQGARSAFMPQVFEHMPYVVGVKGFDRILYADVYAIFPWPHGTKCSLDDRERVFDRAVVIWAVWRRKERSEAFCHKRGDVLVKRDVVEDDGRVWGERKRPYEVRKTELIDGAIVYF